MAVRVLLALGSNLENPARQIEVCINAIAGLAETTLLQRSSLYSSSPRGPIDQSNYVNAAVLIETTLSAPGLLKQTQAIEQEMGRVKTRHWGERIIDIDIAFFGMHKLKLADPDLTIPHKEALIRDFVVVPCLEIASDWKLPDGRLLRETVGHCLQHDLHKIDANLACP